MEPLCWPLLGRTAWTTLPQLPSNNSKNDSISSFLSFQTIDLTGNVGENELDVGGAFVEGVGRQVAVEDAGVVVSEIMSSTFNAQKLRLLTFRHPIKALHDYV